MENKATVKDSALNDAFQEGFKEGVKTSTSTQWVYEIEFVFEGNLVRRVQYSTFDSALPDVREHLTQGPGAEVNTKVLSVPLGEMAAQARQPVDAGASGTDDSDVVDAEIVE